MQEKKIHWILVHHMRKWDLFRVLQLSHISHHSKFKYVTESWTLHDLTGFWFDNMNTTSVLWFFKKNILPWNAVDVVTLRFELKFPYIWIHTILTPTSLFVTFTLFTSKHGHFCFLSPSMSLTAVIYCIYIFLILPECRVHAYATANLGNF